MRKYNEGYALALVLVVMVVLCLISVTVLSFSLRNLQTQQMFVERMQDKYTAQGEIEKIVAQLEAGWNGNPVETGSADKIVEIKNWLASSNIPNAESIEVTVNGEEFSFTVELCVSGDPDAEYIYTAKCNMNVSGKIKAEYSEVTQKTTHTISNVKVEYTSYEIGGASQ